MDFWVAHLHQRQADLNVRRIVFNNGSRLPALTPEEADNIDFQILQISLRGVVPDESYLGARAGDDEHYERALERSLRAVDHNLDAILHYNETHGTCSFVLGFVVPQQNPMGRLRKRYHLSNMAYYVERLNQHIAERLEGRRNTFYVDLNEIVSTYGRKYFLDDPVYSINHGAIIGDIRGSDDASRIESVGDVGKVYTPQYGKMVAAIFDEVVSNYRAVKGIDAVKLVIFDLDDTLWRGVAAEKDELGPDMTEGWPLGLLEAASYLWRRGVMIAIVSKNDRENAVKAWNALYEGRFSLDKFVATRINWNAKADNIRDIIEAVNVLPTAVLFVDDNPVERAAARDAIPGLRVLDCSVVHWRRTLLWASETQPPFETPESRSRTVTVKAQIEREAGRVRIGRDAFLKDLNLRIDVLRCDASEHPRFDRCIELINKTNQFNATGQRWSLPEIEALLRRGGHVFGFDVTAQNTPYGLTAVCLVEGDTIQQFVMSCRVFGMGVEETALALAVEHIRGRGHRTFKARCSATDRNHLAIDFLGRICAETEDGIVVVDPDKAVVPAHVAVTGDRGDGAA